MSLDAMKQALAALELLARYENPATKIQIRKPRDGGSIVTMYPHKVASEAATALRAAIEQAQEPVAWADMDVHGEDKGLSWTPGHFHKTPLYTAPRQWQGLTDEELREAYLAVSGNEWCLGGMSNAESFYEAIEAKLKEKNA